METVIISELSQSQKNKYHMFLDYTHMYVYNHTYCVYAAKVELPRRTKGTNRMCKKLEGREVCVCGSIFNVQCLVVQNLKIHLIILENNYK